MASGSRQGAGNWRRHGAATVIGPENDVPALSFGNVTTTLATTPSS
jgi:hypothetical protein